MRAQMTLNFGAPLLGIAGSQCAMQRTCAFQIGSYPRMTPNPSIEGTHKRLRLLRSPHVKR